MGQPDLPVAVMRAGASTRVAGYCLPICRGDWTGTDFPAKAEEAAEPPADLAGSRIDAGLRGAQPVRLPGRSGIRCGVALRSRITVCLRKLPGRGIIVMADTPEFDFIALLRAGFGHRPGLVTGSSQHPPGAVLEQAPPQNRVRGVSGFGAAACCACAAAAIACSWAGRRSTCCAASDKLTDMTSLYGLASLQSQALKQCGAAIMRRAYRVIRHPSS